MATLRERRDLALENLALLQQLGVLDRRADEILLKIVLSCEGSVSAPELEQKLGL